MVDSSERFMVSIKARLAEIVDADKVGQVIDVIVYELRDYDLQKKSTEIVPYCDDNERIIKSFISCLIVEGRSKGTATQYIYSLKRLFAFNGNKRYDLITPRDIMAWFASLKLSGCKSVTVRNQRSNIMPFFDWLYSNGLIDRNPCDPIKPIRVPVEEKEAFSSEEIDTIRSNCKTDLERALVEFLYASGVRIEEAATLKLDDINFKTLVVKVKNGKGGKDRTTFINPVARKYLKKYLKNCKHKSEYVFTTKFDGCYTTGGLRDVTVKLTERCGFRVHPHRFRRTLATDLARQGMPIQEIQKLLGHSSISTTQGYIDTRTEKVESSYRQFVA